MQQKEGGSMNIMREKTAAGHENEREAVSWTNKITCPVPDLNARNRTQSINSLEVSHIFVHSRSTKVGRTNGKKESNH